jgi:hypothetical protein
LGDKPSATLERRGKGRASTLKIHADDYAANIKNEGLGN